ncbi:MAG: histidine kinase, partial [Acidimicrobiia bacterium]
AYDYAMYSLLANPGSLPGGIYAAWLPSWIWIPATSLISTFVFLVFPTGHLLSRRWRWAVAYSIPAVAIPSAVLAIFPGPLENFRPVRNPFGIEGMSQSQAVVLGERLLGLYMVAIVISVVALVIRYRRSRGEERQQMKWFVTAAAFGSVTLSFSFFNNAARQGLEPWRGVDVLVILSFLTIPIASGIAILRYRLYEIDVVINRAVVYAILAVFITLIYAVVVIVPAAVIGSGSFLAGENSTGGRGTGSLVFSIVATAIAAVAFQPVRSRAQRFANRIVYGDRATPYETMSEFSQRMSALISLEDVLPRVAEAAAKGIGAARARALVYLPDGATRSSEWPSDLSVDGFDETVVVRYGDEVVGELAVSKPPSDPITPDEKKLLADLASQAGLALSNVRLTEELQERLLQISRQAEELRASRQRIVAAQDGERRRLERDIHDGAQQQLVSMAVKLRLAKQMLERDAAKANEVLDSVIGEANDAVESLRDLARGIFPPLLADEGLVSALKGHISKLEIQASVEAPDGFSKTRFGQSVEAAIYFCCLEAMQNASKHAHGSPITVTFSAADNVLEFSVRDQGSGFEASSMVRGSGLQSMTDRMEALGGTLTIESSPGAGTTIRGKIPIDAAVAA